MGSRPTGVNTLKRPPTLSGGTSASSTLLGVGNGHDDLASHLLAALLLTLFLQQTESQSSLSCGAALGDIDDTEATVLQVLSELVEIVLADIVAGKEDVGVLALVGEPLEAVAQGLDDSAGTEIGAADASHDNGVAVLAKRLDASLELRHELSRDAAGQVEPAKEIITCTGAGLESLLCLFCLRCEGCNLLRTQQSL